ncbi:hypothetical protein AKJ61_04700 [candidate division MSBL1 archaeon SCGC-AAA259B11]|uniref:DUF5320 domain-containing protein n=1 Tax=candidate division MSBL1 archaeon SCGC-AAA259B11 TaxID=1698260 RepID=A0A133U2W5_9EURY|nr:hypothetical protein AKJ61_04700 [candidate division MSBL1 archaeon SCGC-AAA259B11]
MGQHGHRNMFYATGLPGWMRFGYSPGWGGMPPGAQYLQRSGQMPQAMNWFQQQASEQPVQPQEAQIQAASPPAFQPQMPAQFSREQEIQMLESELQCLEEQIELIKDRIERLRR